MSNAPELLVIYPNNRRRAYGELGSDVAAITPPVQAALFVAYALQRGVSADLLDADALGLLPDQVAAETARRRPRLACLCTDYLNSGDVTKMAAASETIRALKNAAPDIPVLLEGVVPSAYPEKTLAEEGCDYVCRGEAYEPLVGLVRALRRRAEGPAAPLEDIPGLWPRGGAAPGGQAPMLEAAALPRVPWHLMPPARYRAHHWHCFDNLDRRAPYGAVFTTLGCPFGCSFCSVNVVAGRPNYRVRPLEHVLDEIDELVTRHGVRNLRILDNVFTLQPERVEELCDRLIARRYDLNMWAYARAESIRHPELLKKMKQAGVNWLAYGFESASERVRAAISKRTPTTTMDRVIGWTYDAGIHIVGNFIFGLPEDTLETMRLSLDMAKAYCFEWANFYSAMAYPGTALYEEARQAGLPLPKTWSGYGQYSADSTPLPTRYLTSRQVLEFRDAAFVEYYTFEGYRRRLRQEFGPAAVAFVDRILSVPLRRNPSNSGAA